MTINCDKCQAEIDAADKFCRNCGGGVVGEAAYRELAGDPAPPGALAAPAVIEVNGSLPSTAPDGTSVVEAGGSGAGQLTRKVSARLGQVLKSESGRQLARGAGALAVAVGVELAHHAARRLSQAGSTPAGGGALARPPVNLADAMLKAFEEGISSQAGNTGEIEEIYIHERITLRRIIRKRPG